MHRNGRNSTHKIEIETPISESFQEKAPGGRDQLMFVCLLLLFFVVCLQCVRLLVISSLFVSLRLNDWTIRVLFIVFVPHRRTNLTNHTLINQCVMR